ALWRGLYGVRPFAGSTREELLGSIGSGRRRFDPSAGVPEWLAAAVARGLAEDPDERWADMHELLDALLDEPPEEPSLEDEDVWTAPASGRSSSPVRHAPTWLAFGLGAAVTCVGLLGAMSWTPSDPPMGSSQPAL